MSDLMDQLQKLGDLKAQGILTEEEFQAQKAKLLNG
ncbi:MAG: SHOCT domain-containing protein [Microthrixaceae bacterium]